MKKTLDKLLNKEYFDSIKSIYFVYLVTDQVKFKYSSQLLNNNYGVCEIDINTIIDKGFLLDKKNFFEVEDKLFYSFCFTKSEYESSLNDFHRLINIKHKIPFRISNILKIINNTSEKTSLYFNIFSFGFTHFKFKFSHILTADRIIKYMVNPYYKNPIKLARINFYFARVMILVAIFYFSILIASMS